VVIKLSVDHELLPFQPLDHGLKSNSLKFLDSIK